ncbi:MAG: hypothetical protein ACREVV_10815 [Steroidobacteraceae bacterium]
MPYFDDLYQPGGTVYLTHHNVNQIALSTLDATAHNQRYFPYILKTTDDEYALGSNANPVTEVVTSYVLTATVMLLP